MWEVISSFMSLRAGSHVFALLMLFPCDYACYAVGQEPASAMHPTSWYDVPVCHQNDACKNYAGSVYVGMSESGLSVLHKLCPMAFLLLVKVRRPFRSMQPCRTLTVVMMDKWSDDIGCSAVHDVRLYSVLSHRGDIW